MHYNPVERRRAAIAARSAHEAAIAARAAQEAAEAAQTSQDAAPEADPSGGACSPPGRDQAAPGSRFRGNDEEGRDDEDRRDDERAGDDGVDASDLQEVPACAGTHEAPERYTIFGPKSQGDFLASLAEHGNVRLAARAARVSAQTAYRARRRSPALARAWDAAVHAARDHVEQVLADRAVNGWEEPVFYRGEEIARRRRYSDRLLLAHLARLDRLAEREEIAATLPLLDDAIERLQAGEALAEPRECVPAEAGTSEGCDRLPETPASAGAHDVPQYPVPDVPSCRTCGGQCNDPAALLTQADCQWLGNRLERMDAARPEDAPTLSSLATALCDAGEVEALQLAAFEAGEAEWWLVPRNAEDERLRDAQDSLETCA